LNKSYNFIDILNSDICLTNAEQTYINSNIYTNNLAIYFNNSANSNTRCVFDVSGDINRRLTIINNGNLIGVVMSLLLIL
jgi:hypothetical protein